MKLALHRQWTESRRKGFLNLLECDIKAKVVDLGCGNGDFSVRAKEKIGCSEIMGIDIMDENIKKAEKRGVISNKADLDDALPLENSFFDVVVSDQVIEHLFYPVKFMKEVYRILKPGGYAVISTENLASWDNIFALLLGYLPFSMQCDSGLLKIGNPFSPHEKELKKDSTRLHVRIFTYHSMFELARFLSFRVEAVSASGHVLGRFGETVDKKHCRFISIKLRK